MSRIKFKTEENSTGLTILDVVSKVGESLTIPNKIGGVKITSIGDNFLYYNESLTSIKLPSGLTSIGDYFLCYNESLRSIKLPSGLTSIGNYFLCYNELLTSIKPPSGLTSIGNYFLGCNRSVTSIKLPSGLTSIGDDFLYYNKSLISIVLPSSLISIGDCFLNNNKSLTSIVLNKKMFEVKNVDDYMMILYSIKKKNDLTIYNCKFLSSMNKSIVVEKDNVFSHGKTLKDAMNDLNFKILQSSFDLESLVLKIKQTNKITINDYRLLTGACKYGVEQFIQDKKLKKDYLSVKECIKLTKGYFGHDKIVELLGI